MNGELPFTNLYLEKWASDTGWGKKDPVFLCKC
jgi:hypothetical protein